MRRNRVLGIPNTNPVRNTVRFIYASQQPAELSINPWHRDNSSALGSHFQPAAYFLLGTPTPPTPALHAGKSRQSTQCAQTHIYLDSPHASWHAQHA